MGREMRVSCGNVLFGTRHSSDTQRTRIKPLRPSGALALTTLTDPILRLP